MPAKVEQNFRMHSANHKNVTFTVTDGDGASVDCTGACVTWWLSEEPESGSLIKRHTDSGCGISVSGCTFTVSLSPTHTSGLSGTYYHESKMRDSASQESTVAVGWAQIFTDAIG